jgi:two-component system sensor histidine kinase ChvG
MALSSESDAGAQVRPQARRAQGRARTDESSAPGRPSVQMPPFEGDTEGEAASDAREALSPSAPDAVPGAPTSSQSGQAGRKGLLARLVSPLFASLTRRIVIFNLAALAALVVGILYLNQFREGLIDAKVESLLIQGQIIAGAVAASAAVETDAIAIDPERLIQLEAGQSLTPAPNSRSSLEFPIDPERVAPILRRLITPTKTRARIYDNQGVLLLDSRHIYTSGQVLRFDLPAPDTQAISWRDWISDRFHALFQPTNLSVYQELGPHEGRSYPEVVTALEGKPASLVRIAQSGELIVSVGVPVQRFRSVYGALVLSTQGSDIDAIVRAERIAILRVFMVAAVVSLFVSALMARNIAGPMRRLAAAADRVRVRMSGRAEIPDFTYRSDEIGHLSGALRDMTNALYLRIEAIERFAADVAHELKNPLTSLRSAVETLPLAKNDEQRARLIEIVQHDVQRLDRLISDISDASRLDAELARDDIAVFDFGELLGALTRIGNELRGDEGPALTIDMPEKQNRKALLVNGHEHRLGQVINNLIDNARSFSPPDGTIALGIRRQGPDVVITVDDDGPGIPEENLSRIFERFYTDRTTNADLNNAEFGQNSGLGLSISEQIIKAHHGAIRAENRMVKGRVVGARFIVSLPAAGTS